MAPEDTTLQYLYPISFLDGAMMIETDGTRQYIPLPCGWEIQTKGQGSSFRLLDRKTGERMSIMLNDSHREHDFVTRMAVEIHHATKGWQPIETAPEGRCIMWVADGGWRSEGVAVNGRVFLHGYERICRPDGYNGKWNVTHWQPSLVGPDAS